MKVRDFVVNGEDVTHQGSASSGYWMDGCLCGIAKFDEFVLVDC